MNNHLEDLTHGANNADAGWRDEIVRILANQHLIIQDLKREVAHLHRVAGDMKQELETKR
jgi:hypothetical protein